MKRTLGVVGLGLTLAAALPQRVVVSRDTVDVDRDGAIDTVSIVMTAGRRHDDSDAAWCGAGDKYEGSFSVTVSSRGRIVETPLDSLLGGAPLWFPARPWALALADYNEDGRVELNLGQYGSCNGWIYRMLSISDSGRVERVSESFRVSDFAPSTSRVRAVKGGFQTEYYDNAQAHAGHWLVTYTWNPASHLFERAAEIRR